MKRRRPSKISSRPQAVRVLVLAAAAGPRLMGSVPKVLHRVGGLSLLESVLRAVETLVPSRIVVLLGPTGATIEASLAGRAVCVTLAASAGATTRAVRSALSALGQDEAPLLVLSGDQPLIRPETLAALVRRQQEQSLDLVFLTCRPPEPGGLPRVVRDRRGRIRSVGEERRRTAAANAAEIPVGIYCFGASAVEEVLAGKGAGRRPGADAPLSDAIEILASRSGRVDSIETPDWREAWGIETRRDLAAAEEISRRRCLERALDAGATLIDPATIRIGPEVRVEADAIVHPFVSLEGRTVLHSGCEVLCFSRVADSEVSAGAIVGPHCDVEGARIGGRARVGPFARLRPETVLEEDVRVGNFVETKKALLRRGAKASHLSYLGDTEIGADTNIGAGVITCNYDGEKKNRTSVGANAFVGSGSQLVAPVTVGDGAYVGAGSTITRDVPAGALALTRVEQKIVEGWSQRRKARPARKP